MRVEQIAQKLAQAREAYYNGSPVMSDASYDALEDELKRLQPNHPLLRQIGAPVPTSSGWPKVRHDFKMSSLNKAQDMEELVAWWKSCGSPSGLYITEKLDGISISLRYESGVMVQALTRGDGVIGENITRNVLRMKGFPKQVLSQSGGLFSGYVRGEIIVRHSDFETYFPDDSNPRNTASGTAKRQSDPSLCQHLTVLSYQVIPDSGVLPHKQDEIQWLIDQGFGTPRAYPVESVKSVQTLYDTYIEKTRGALDYDIDGLVVDVNNEAARDSLGILNNRPKGSVALKFPHEEKSSVLRDIIWQVGHSGRLTPVAVFDPVVLAGAQVSRASLYNVDYYHEIASQLSSDTLSVGDEIMVSRRNDVIPAVEAGLCVGDGKDLPIPTICPECQSSLEMDGRYLICPNLVGCPSQRAGAIKRWIKGIGVLGWGPAIVDALYEQGLVTTPADLYDLEDDELASVQMSGRRVGSSAKLMLDNLHEKKELPLHVIVGSIGIPMIGQTMVKIIVSAGYDNLQKLFRASEKQIASIQGVGQAKASSFVRGMETGIGTICDLLSKGITVAKETEGPLKGKMVCMTGFRDPSMQAEIESQGGTVKSGVSKKLDYLVAQDPSSTSGKAKKARDYGIPIINVEEMWSLLGGKSAS